MEFSIYYHYDNGHKHLSLLQSIRKVRGKLVDGADSFENIYAVQITSKSFLYHLLKIPMISSCLQPLFFKNFFLIYENKDLFLVSKVSCMARNYQTRTLEILEKYALKAESTQLDTMKTLIRLLKVDTGCFRNLALYPERAYIHSLKTEDSLKIPSLYLALHEGKIECKKIWKSPVGEGNWKSVYKVKDLISDKIEALVIYKKRNFFQKMFAQREREIYQFLKRRGVSRIVGVDKMLYSQNGSIIGFMEYCNGKLAKQHFQDLSDREKFQFLAQIAEVVLNCHNNNIIHSDIKFDNILIKDKLPYLSDFGLSMRKRELALINLFSIAVSIADFFYKNSLKAFLRSFDDWSFGLLLVEAFIKKEKKSQYIEARLQGESISLENDLQPNNPKLVDLIDRLLQKNSKNRIKMSEAYSILQELSTSAI